MQIEDNRTVQGAAFVVDDEIGARKIVELAAPYADELRWILSTRWVCGLSEQRELRKGHEQGERE